MSTHPTVNSYIRYERRDNTVKRVRVTKAIVYQPSGNTWVGKLTIIRVTELNWQYVPSIEGIPYEEINGWGSCKPTGTSLRTPIELKNWLRDKGYVWPAGDTATCVLLDDTALMAHAEEASRINSGGNESSLDNLDFLHDYYREVRAAYEQRAQEAENEGLDNVAA